MVRQGLEDTARRRMNEREGGSEDRAGNLDGPSAELDELESHVARQLMETAEVMHRTAERLSSEIARLGHMVLKTLDGGGKLLFCGNGGSAADAQHLAAEYVVRYQRARSSLPALALTTDTSVLTAVGNDLGFEKVFARQVASLGRPADLLILHSTSGSSPNLVEATHAARRLGLRTVALLAGDGGVLKDLVDLAIIVPTSSTARAQEAHLAIGHAVVEWIDSRGGGSG